MKKTRLMIPFVLGTLFLFVIYYPCFKAPLLSTDDHLLFRTPQIEKAFEFESLKSLFRIDGNIDYYPLRDMSYMVDSYFWHDSLFAARVHQFLLFSCSVFVFFLILRKWGITYWIALLSSFAVLLNPFFSETILWISARKDVLAFFWGILSLYLFVKAHKNKDFVLSFVFLILSFLSKASLVLLPFAGLLYYLHQRKKVIVLTMMSVVALTFSILQTYFYSHVTNMQIALPWTERLQISITALGKMFVGLVWPRINILDLDQLGDWSKQNNEFFYFGLLLWTVIIFWGVRSLFKKNVRDLSFIILLLSLYVPISGLVFPHLLFYSTRYFLPVAFLLFCLLAKFLSHKKNSILILCFLLAWEVWGLLAERKYWASEVGIREKSFWSNPQSLSLKTNYYSTLKDVSVRNLHYQELEKECLKSEIIEPNCREFYRQGFAEGFFKNDESITLLFLNQYEKLAYFDFVDLKLSYQYRFLKIDKKSLEKNLAKKFTPTPEARYNRLTALCLLSRDLEAQRLYQKFVQQHLILTEENEMFIEGMLHPLLRESVIRCLKIMPGFTYLSVSNSRLEF